MVSEENQSNLLNINSSKKIEPIDLKSYLEIKRKDWYSQYIFTIKNNKEDTLLLIEENGKIIAIKSTRGKLKKEILNSNSKIFVELMNYNNEVPYKCRILDFEYKNESKKVLEVNIEALNLNLQKKKFYDFINHFSVKNVFENEIDQIYKLSAIHKRVGVFFKYVILSSFKRDRIAFYCITFCLDKGINEFSRSDRKFRVFSSVKYKDFTIFSKSKFEKLQENFLVFFTDKQSKKILQNHFNYQIKTSKNIFNDVNSAIEEIKNQHSQINKKVLEINEVSINSGLPINLLDLDFYFYRYLQENNYILYKDSILKPKNFALDPLVTLGLNNIPTTISLNEDLENHYLYISDEDFIKPFSHTKGIFNDCFIVKIRNTTIKSVLSSDIGFLKEFINLLIQKNLLGSFNQGFDEWVRKSTILPLELKNKIKILNYKFLENELQKILDQKISIIFRNKSILILQENKQMDDFDFKVMKKLDKVIVLNERTYIFSQNNSIKVFGEAEFPSTIKKIFNNEEVTDEDVYNLILKSNASINCVLNLIEVLKLQRETSILEGNCYKLYKKNQFEFKTPYISLDYLCKCKNDNLIFTNGSNNPCCYKCYAKVFISDLEDSLLQKIKLESSKKPERRCNKCKRYAKKKLETVCECGGAFEYERFEAKKYFAYARTEKTKMCLNEFQLNI